MASKRALQNPTFGQVICANSRCLVLHTIAYLAVSGGFYLAVYRQSMPWTIVVCIILILSAGLSIRYRDVGSRHMGCKAHVQWITLLCAIICDIFALMHTINNEQWMLWLIIVLFSISWVLSVFGIYHSKVVIANLQPQIGRRIRDNVLEDSTQL